MYCSNYDICATERFPLITLGRSLHRGKRAAGWFDDLIGDRANTNKKSVVLFEGISGWTLAGKDYEGFVSQTWTEGALDES
jgi:hypothetical protein